MLVVVVVVLLLLLLVLMLLVLLLVVLLLLLLPVVSSHVQGPIPPVHVLRDTIIIINNNISINIIRTRHTARTF